MLNVRAYGLVILFAIGLALVGVVGIQNNWGVFSLPTREKLLNLEAGNDDAYEEGALDMAAVDLYFKVRPPANNEEVRQLDFMLDDVVLWLRDDDESVNIATVCLTEVYSVVNPRGEFTYPHDFLREPICINPTEDDYAIGDVDFLGYENFDNAVILNPTETVRGLAVTLPLQSIDEVGLNFWYPFDRFDTELDIYVAYSITLDDGETFDNLIQPFISWDLQTSGHRLWQINVNSTSITVSDAEYGDIPYDRVSFSFERPLIYRLIFPFFMVMMVLLIGLVPLLNDRDTLVDICAAMLFGIFGLKGIIGPGEAMGQTLLDLSLIGLYVVLAFAGLVFFVNRVMTRNQPSQEPSES